MALNDVMHVKCFFLINQKKVADPNRSAKKVCKKNLVCVLLATAGVYIDIYVRIVML